MPEKLVAAALQKGVRLEISPFISTAPLRTTEVISEIEGILQMQAAVVFTSVQAVEAVAAVMDNMLLPDWQVFCIGEATRRRVEKFFGATVVMATAPDATQLAAAILENEPGEELFFFCGDQRRPELPEILSREGIELTEIVVYETLPLPHSLPSANYAGVLFFSPSAVASFFKNNKLPEHCIAFAIGDTTARDIRKFSNNLVVVSETPSKEALLDKALEIIAT